jgi:hypothetical protein
MEPIFFRSILAKANKKTNGGVGGKAVVQVFSLFKLFVNLSKDGEKFIEFKN